MQLEPADIFRREWREGRGEIVQAEELKEFSLTVQPEYQQQFWFEASFQEVPSVFLLCHLLWLQEVCEGPTKEASQPSICRGLNFSPCLLTNLMIFLITSGFKSLLYYFFPVAHSYHQPKKRAQYFQRV